jgi:16S rRNA A1518/A1519 N6-dimethyltransferase RsmA/KsgA/DIM1 with predicted DNA glycosylase/AP lyase activity
MRPGGMELTHKMLGELEIDQRDRVVELAPGRGATTRMVLRLLPQSYTAVERRSLNKMSKKFFVMEN